MSENTSELIISKLPEINLTVNAEFDYVTFGSILITAIVILGTTFFTIYSFNKNIKSQEKISEEKTKIEVLSKNRQDWINTLRDTISELLAVILSFSNRHNELSSRAVAWKVADSDNTFKDAINLQNRYSAELSEAFRLRTKIDLLLNPNENDSKKLQIAINEAIKEVKNKDVDLDQKCERIIHYSQIILKKEWERVKSIE